jgi:NADPH:quinone reductase-like Zn-dependent oxidoreductase
MSTARQGAVTALLGSVPAYYGVRWFMRGPEYRSNARLDGKTVAVTGANSGIGYETAKEFCRRGARVLLLCRNEKKGAQAVKKMEDELNR